MTTAVLDKLAEQHPDDNTIVAYCQKVVGEATDFVKQKDLVTVPDKPLEVDRHAGVQARAGASPIAIRRDRSRKTAKHSSRSNRRRKDWTKERKESFFREYNNYMVRDLTVHEAMPGHYLQLAHSNEFKAPTLVRAIFQSGTFIEGWAVYTEQVMAEAGYGGPEVKMQQLKMRLRVICNAILDQSIHAGNMSEQEAHGPDDEGRVSAGRRSGREMETRPAYLSTTFDLFRRRNGTSRTARTSQSEGRCGASI